MGFRLLALALAACLIPAWPQTPAAAAFDKLKTLAGEWEGQAPDKSTATVTYHLVSGGSAVMETIRGQHADEMISVYHRDGESILMTHYCMINNQPRMRATPKTGNPREIKFDFVDVANLASPEAGHMRGLAITFEDPTHVNAAWTYREKGKDSTTVFRLTRKR